MVTINDSLAKIAISKNLVKEYKSKDCDRTVFLNNGTEFQIYLKNPYQCHLGIKIYVNDKSIGSMFVLKPGQSYWLDRFLDRDDKFLFSTYDVENTAEMQYATSKNGKVRIEFYREKEQNLQTFLSVLNDSDTVIKHINHYSDTITTSGWSGGTYTYNATPVNHQKVSCSNANTITTSSQNNDIFSFDLCDTRLNDTVETGRVERGSKSDQKFRECDIEFNYWSDSIENILILPNSRKQVRSEDVRRKYCSQCGKKVSPKDKFCSNCGAKLK